MPEEAGLKQIRGIVIGILGDSCINIHIIELVGHRMVVTIEGKMPWRQYLLRTIRTTLDKLITFLLSNLSTV